MREEWITNITHDLKTPLSPIRGYAELLLENGVPEEGSCRQYAAVMLKNTAYMETLIDDLKLTYQLDNRMLPIHRSRQDIVRFLKELAIDILNTPEYENRTIHFLSDDASILFSFDLTLLTRAFRNLIINAFVHGNENTEVTILAAVTDSALQIAVADNGPETGGHRPWPGHCKRYCRASWRQYQRFLPAAPDLQAPLRFPRRQTGFAQHPCGQQNPVPDRLSLN